MCAGRADGLFFALPTMATANATGLGLAIIGSKLTNSPLVFGLGFGPDFLHRLDGLAHPLEAGCLDGAVVFISSWFQPPPTPNRNRPRLTWSIEATSLAVWIASRCCTSSTPVPSFMVLVTWLAAAGTTYRGVALPQKSISDPRADLDMIFLYCRPMLDYWCESGEDLRRLVRHV